MSKQVLYKDLGKRTNDLLTKEFPSEKQENKVEYIGRTPNQVTFETSFTARKDGSVFGVFTPKYKFLLNGMPTQVLAELNTRKEFRAEAVVEDAFTKNLKATLTGQTKDDEVFATLALEYRHELATVNASVDYGRVKGSTVKGGVVVGKNGFSLGATSEYFVGNTTESDLKEFATTLGYSAPEYDVTVFGRLDYRSDDDKQEFGATYFHRVNSDLAVGSEVVFDNANPETKPRLAFGTQYRFVDDSVFKGKFDTMGKVGLSYQQRLNKNAKLTVASTVDTNNLNSKGASTFGFTLSFTD
jgi:hypothetical protein